MPKDLREWILFAITIASVFVAGVAAWFRMVGKVNGLGKRVRLTEDSCKEQGGKMAAIESEQVSMRAEYAANATRMGRVEKGQDDLRVKMEEIQVNVTAHLISIEKLILEKQGDTKETMGRHDERIKRNDERLTQVERNRG